MSIKAYQTLQDTVTDPRHIEIVVFQRCNALLGAAAEAHANGNAATDPVAAKKCEAEALFEHERLWTSLLADLAADDNQLPAPLRARLISLGLWACRHADDVRYRHAAIEPLIELNNQMIAGLTESLATTRVQAIVPATTSAGPSAPIIT